MKAWRAALLSLACSGPLPPEPAPVPPEPDAGCRLPVVPACDAGTVGYQQVQALFDRACVVCHKDGAKLFGGVFLTAPESYEQLVGAESRCDGRVRVRAGDPTGSALWWKLAGGECLCGKPMPSGTTLAETSPLDFCLVDAWIREGAPPL